MLKVNDDIHGYLINVETIYIFYIFMINEEYLMFIIITTKFNAYFTPFESFE